MSVMNISLWHFQNIIYVLSVNLLDTTEITYMYSNPYILISISSVFGHVQELDIISASI